MIELLTTIDNKIKDFQKLALATHDELWKVLTRRNTVLMYLTAALAMLIQAYNFTKIFISSSSGLSSLNNKIYFIFYLSLFLYSFALILVLKRLKNNTIVLYRVQLISVSFYLLWNLGLNTYGIYKGHTNSSLLFTTALIFTSILIRFKPTHTLILQIVSTFIFSLLNFSMYGETFNTINATIVAVIVNYALYSQNVITISNGIKLQELNILLKKQQNKLRLNLQKYEIITTEAKLFSFDWNLEDDALIFSGDLQKSLGFPTEILDAEEWFEENDFVFEPDKDLILDLVNSCINNHEQGNLDIRLRDNKERFIWFHLSVFVQYDTDNTPINLIGILQNIDGSKRLIQNLYNQLQIQTEGAKQYLQHLKSSQDKTAIYHHDIKHSLNLLSQLAAQGDIERIQSYVSLSNEEIDEIKPEFHCDNETVNLILGSFNQLAHGNGVSFKSEGNLPKNLPILDTELCSLYYNLLENALTAAKNVPLDSHPFIHVTSRLNRGQLVIFVENSFNGDVLMDDEGIPISIKKDASHGFGVKSIIDIAERYQGLYTFEAQDSIFVTKVLLLIC